MTINRSSDSPGPRVDAGHAARLTPVAPRASGARAAVTHETPVANDVVAFSPAARAMAAREGDETLSAERLVALRQQVLEGAYNQADTIAKLAARLRVSGDVR